MIVWMLACSSPQDTATPPVDPVEHAVEAGPYAVGYRESELIYDDTITGTTRTLRLALWYPTDDAEGQDASYNGIFPTDGAWDSAGVAAGGPYPVAVYSHGHQGYAEASGFLMEHLASHGFVVAAPDHTGNTTLEGSDRDTEIYLQRPLDITAVLDHLDALPASDSLAGKVDVAQVIGIGHSFGGYTMLALAGGLHDPDAACAEDPGADFCSTMTEALEDRMAQGFVESRLAVAIPMAAGDSNKFGADGLSQVTVPVVQMTGQLDNPDESGAIWSYLEGGEHRRVDIVGGGHQTFSDFSGILEDMDGLIEPEEGFRIVRGYTAAAAWLHRGDSAYAPILDGEVQISEQAEILR